MGSYNMAFNKILSVLVVAGSSPAWTQPQFFNFNNNGNGNVAAAQSSPTTSTTPVPILRYVDTQNIDGSYTYGYEAADGTYKLETRFVDGRVKGKYGYIDPEGNVREASYGAEAGRGFEPQIEGIELPPPVTTTQAPITNIIADPAPVKQFSNFKETNNRKSVNGRRAQLIKVRRVKATPAPERFIDEEGAKKANLKARQEQLRSLEQHRRQLVKLQQQQQQTSSRQQQSRAFPAFQQHHQESFRSAAPAPSASVSDPYISGFDLNSGAYSYSY